MKSKLENFIMRVVCVPVIILVALIFAFVQMVGRVSLKIVRWGNK